MHKIDCRTRGVVSQRSRKHRDYWYDPARTTDSKQDNTLIFEIYNIVCETHKIFYKVYCLIADNLKYIDFRLVSINDELELRYAYSVREQQQFNERHWYLFAISTVL